MFLRYLVVYNLCDFKLVDALPTIAHWKRASCPDYLSKEEVEKVVVACNPVTAEVREKKGAFAFGRLVLRAGDIVHLRHRRHRLGNGAFQLTERAADKARSLSLKT